MKRRIGFVSNSSSASFLLHTNFEAEQFKNILENEGLYHLVKDSIVTNQLGRGCIEGWVSMWNDENDLPDTIKQVRDMLLKNFGEQSYMITVDYEG